MRLALVDHATGHVVLDTAAGRFSFTLEDARRAFAQGCMPRDDAEAMAIYAGLAADLFRPVYEFRVLHFHRGDDYPSANGGYHVYRLDVPGSWMALITKGTCKGLTAEETSRAVQTFGERLGFVAPDPDWLDSQINACLVALENGPKA